MYKRLHDFIAQRMKMSHIYQPAMLITLLRNGGYATAEEIACGFLSRDHSQLEHYIHITKKMPGRVLQSHSIVEKQGNVYRLVGYETLSEEEVEQLIRDCQIRLNTYLLSRGEKMYSRFSPRGYIPGTTRYNVLKRAKGRCELCGISAAERALDIDHIIPKSKGGIDDESNFQALCSTCNQQKSNRDDTDFRQVLEAYGHREKDCVFCNIKKKRIVDENALAYVVRDRYPVTDLHTLVIPRRHVASYFELGSSEIKACNMLLEEHKEHILKKDRHVTAMNVGINDGADAGQTIFHCHIHLIPRRPGDMADPRGGVRGVIPNKQSY